MFFKDIIGQKKIKDFLIQNIENERVSNAMLFLGPEGCGNLPLALAFAQYMNCENRRPEDSCGECSSCKKSQKLIHPDIHFSFPYITKKTHGKTLSSHYLSEWRDAVRTNPYMNTIQWFKRIDAENKQGNIPVNECSNIKSKLMLKSFESKNKFLIMWMPEYMKNSGNVLLKILEEPPDNTFFILVGENKDLILNTILSRIQLIKIHKISDTDLTKALIRSHDMVEEEAHRICRLADGNYNTAIKMCKNSENNNHQLLIEWLDSCISNKSILLLEWITHFSTLGRENQKNFLKYAIHFFGEWLNTKLQSGNTIKLDADELKIIEKLPPELSFEQLEQIIELTDKNCYYIERNGHPKINMLNLSIHISKILQNKEVFLTH